MPLLVCYYSGGSRISHRSTDLVGGANSRGGYVSKNLYVKTKESGPLGGARRRRPLDLPMYYVIFSQNSAYVWIEIDGADGTL